MYYYNCIPSCRGGQAWLWTQYHSIIAFWEVRSLSSMWAPVSSHSWCTVQLLQYWMIFDYCKVTCGSHNGN